MRRLKFSRRVLQYALVAAFLSRAANSDERKCVENVFTRKNR